VFQVALQVPVVPIATEGSGAVLPAWGFRVRPGKITLRIGDPIPTAGLHSADHHALAQRAHGAVAPRCMRWCAIPRRCDVNGAFTSSPSQYAGVSPMLSRGVHRQRRHCNGFACAA